MALVISVQAVDFLKIVEEYVGIASFSRFLPAVLTKIIFLCVCVCFHLELLKHMYVQKKKKKSWRLQFHPVCLVFFPVGSVVIWDKLLNSLCVSSYDNSSVTNSVVKLVFEFYCGSAWEVIDSTEE